MARKPRPVLKLKRAKPKPKRKLGARAVRIKGDVRERRTVALLKALGLEAKRVPLSGSAEEVPYDIEVTTRIGRLRGEVKCRDSWKGFTFVREELHEKPHNDLLILYGHLTPTPYVAMPWEIFAKLLRG